jgi:hypothetical protein
MLTYELSQTPAASRLLFPFDEDKPSNRCVNLHREHPRPSLFELDFEKVRPRKRPGFIPPRVSALCRRQNGPQGGALQRGSRVGDEQPAFVRLALDISLAGFSLRIARVEGEIEIVLGDLRV